MNTAARLRKLRNERRLGLGGNNQQGQSTMETILVKGAIKTPLEVKEAKTIHPAIVARARDAVARNDPHAALAALKEMFDDPAVGDKDGSADDGAEGVAPPAKVKEKVIDPKVVGASTLTASELKACRDQNCSPENFVAAKAAMNRPIKPTRAG